MLVRPVTDCFLDATFQPDSMRYVLVFWQTKFVVLPLHPRLQV